MNKSKIETYVFFSGLALTVLLFIWLPAHPESRFDFFLNDWVDRSIFSDGYYKPRRYPFAARVVNAVSVVYAVVTGIFMGVWRRDSVIKEKLMKVDKIWLWSLVGIALGCACFWTSISPQEFVVSSGRTFGRSEAFHNNPVQFLFLVICKAGVIYSILRAFITCALYFLSQSKNSGNA